MATGDLTWNEGSGSIPVVQGDTMGMVVDTGAVGSAGSTAIMQQNAGIASTNFNSGTPSPSSLVGGQTTSTIAPVSDVSYVNTPSTSQIRTSNASPATSQALTGKLATSELPPSVLGTEDIRGITNDIIYQKFSVFIEGIEVPFIAASISSGIGTLPSATLEIPAQAGLMDIARFYSPKVHITYRDLVDGDNKDRLLFNGFISTVDYSKSFEGSGRKSIRFQCTHRYKLVDEMHLEYTGILKPGEINPFNGPNVLQSGNSISRITTALEGIEPSIRNEITASNPGGDPRSVYANLKGFENRLIGIPGTVINYWQQIKGDCYGYGDTSVFDQFLKMYMPLIEDGINFFKRMGGHTFLENEIQISKQEACFGNKTDANKVLVPPLTRMFITSAIQSSMAIQLMNNFLQNSGEVSTMYSAFIQFLDSIDYDLLTLTSPAEAPVDPSVGESTYALDTIIKPKMHMYYSPSCNILYPNMYTSINVVYDEYNIPTRFLLKNSENGIDYHYGTNFWGPHSIRQAIAGSIVTDSGYKVPGKETDLITTTGAPSRVGLYEQGRGPKKEESLAPSWLSKFGDSAAGMNLSNSGVGKPSEKDAAYLKLLADGWNTRFPGQDKLNPWTEASGLLPHQRIIVAAVDFYYTQAVARSKAGTVQCLFNPYIIPGYPMDILEASPTDPSFHALCTSVTHSITSNSCSTSVDFAAAMTYSELVNYYTPSMHPWLQVVLGLGEDQTIVGNDKGLEAADKFYGDVLGSTVSVLSPDTLYDFNENILKPGLPVGGVSEGKDIDRTFVGRLSLVYREIESLSSLEEREHIRFVTMHPDLYSSSVFEVQDEMLKQEDKLELGSSQFLDYNEYLNFAS